MKALQEQGYRIGDLCAAFCVSRSGYHRARTAAPSARALSTRTRRAGDWGVNGWSPLADMAREDSRCQRQQAGGA